MKTKLAILLLITAALTGCENKGESKMNTSNPDIPVVLLFEHEGVKVYRFSDSGHDIYYTDARGETAWKQQSGKASVYKSVETAD